MAAPVFPRAGFVQFAVAPGDPAANLRKLDGLLQVLSPRQNTILLLPELWATGFEYSQATRLADETPALLERLIALCVRHNIHLAGSLMEKVVTADGEPVLFNTLYLVGPSGVAGSYRKQHLFGLWQEDRFFSAGGAIGPIPTASGLVGGLVCYDLRFPETARMQAFAGANLIVVSAQWPQVRLDHWRILLQARAIENQVFVVAGNCCGACGPHELAGHSMLVGPDGRILLEAGEGEEARASELPAGALDQVRSRFCSVGERPYPGDDRDKIVTLSELSGRLSCIRQQGSRVAFTNGCFDILHSGHVAYLEEARKTADCLVVGLNSDASVRLLKGPGRPVNPEGERSRVLAALGSVDFVVLFNEETPLDLIRSIMPEVLVKGADWPEEKIVGAAEVKAAGGRVVRIAFAHDVSTTAIISRVNSRE